MPGSLRAPTRSTSRRPTHTGTYESDNPASYAWTITSHLFDGSPGTGRRLDARAVHDGRVRNRFAADCGRPGRCHQRERPRRDVRLQPAVTHSMVGDVLGHLEPRLHRRRLQHRSALDVSSLTIMLPAGTQAFYFYAEPNHVRRPFDVTATAQDGTTSGPIQVKGNVGAVLRLLRVGGADYRVDHRHDRRTSGFAVGEFGISLARLPIETGIQTVEGPAGAGPSTSSASSASIASRRVFAPMRTKIARARSSSARAPVRSPNSGGTAERHRASAELEGHLELLDQPQRLGERGRGRRRLARRGRDDRLRQQQRRARVRVLLRQVARGEGDDLARVVEPVLRDERLGELAVRLDHDPAADLERDRHRLAQPCLGLVRPPVCEREARQALRRGSEPGSTSHRSARTTSAPEGTDAPPLRGRRGGT